MSGTVRVKGFASESAGASGHGGLLVIEGDASLRCGISLKGLDIVVGGSVGNFSAFMAQAGTLLICGDAGHALGDSLYEAVIYVRGKIKSLGADAREEPMTDADIARVKTLLERASLSHNPKEFKRVASVINFKKSQYEKTLSRPMPFFLGVPQKIETGWEFYWDPSRHLQGHEIAYDFDIARTPSFQPQSILFSLKGLKALTASLLQALPTGHYYFRVIARDVTNPLEDWQIAFDSTLEGNPVRSYHGVSAFDVP